MAVRIPGPQDLGPAPRANPTQPVATYDISPLERGAQAISQGARQLGAGFEQAGAGLESLASAQARYQYTQANTQFLSQKINLDAQTAADQNYGPDENGKDLPTRYSDQLSALRDQAASQIGDGPMRQLFMAKSQPTLEQGVIRAQAHARALGNNAQIAYVSQAGDQAINQAVAAPDDATRAQIIDAHNELIDGLAGTGAITQTQAVAMKQGWAHQYITADALAAGNSGDPARIQGVLNEITPAPGSRDAVLNRIIQIEGTGANGKSSATGVGQFTDGTWLDEVKRNRPDLAEGRTDQQILALRADPALGREMTGHYLDENTAALQKQGLPTTPGNVYLAHFLGATGAAAVLKADPNMPVADALTQAVGPEKAQAMIAANPSVLQGKLAGSVKSWADGLMGGAAPGGGSIYDMLRPDVREQVVAHLQMQLQKLNVQAEVAFGARVQDATSEAMATGNVTNPIPQSQFIALYGAARGQREFEKYDTAVQTGHAIAGMATATPEQRTAIVQSLAPTPGEEGYAIKERAYQVALRAAKQIGDQIEKDPAGFAIARLPASQEAYGHYSQALANPTASDGDRASAAQGFAAATLLEQQHAGIPPDQARILPKADIDRIKGAFANAATSDDPQARLGLIGEVQKQKAMWGNYWPDVVRELSPQLAPTVKAIAAGADPTAMARLLSLDPKQNPAAILKEQSATKASDLQKGLATAFAPLLSTMVGRQRDRDFPDYYNLAQKLGALYVRDGQDGATAAQNAFNALIGNRYDFRDTYRIPKSAGVSADDVQHGAQLARDMIAAGPQATGSEGSGLTPQQILQRNAPYLKPGATDFYTKLNAPQETQFRDWVSKNKINFDPNEKLPDYDMRGFWKALQDGDPRAKQAIDPNDNRIHYPDYWKTPYDLTFSNESQWANDSAPRWNDRDQLVTPEGKVVFDDRAAHAPSTPFGIKPPIDDKPGRSDPAGSDMGIIARNGIWVTAPDNSGLYLMYRSDRMPGPAAVRGQDGAPLRLTWAQLAGLAHQANAAAAKAPMPMALP